METLGPHGIAGTDLRSGIADEARLRRSESEHRIANSFQIAAAALAQERRGVIDVETARAALAAMSARLLAMAHLHRTLSAVLPCEDVEIGAYLCGLRAEIEHGIGTALRIDVRGLTIAAQTAAQIGIIVTEMATNAAKHAAADGHPAVLTVEADTNGLGEVRLRIHDDGPGFPEGLDLQQTRSVGLMIIRATVERLGGYVYLMPRFGPYLLTGAGLEIVLPPRRRHGA